MPPTDQADPPRPAMLRRIFNSCLQKRSEPTHSKSPPIQQTSTETDESDATLVPHPARPSSKSQTSFSARPEAEVAPKNRTMPRLGSRTTEPAAPKPTRGRQLSSQNTKKPATSTSNALSDADVERLLNGIFDSLATPNPTTSGPAPDALDFDAVARYSEAVGVSLANHEYLVLAELVEVKSLGQIARSGFVRGWSRVWRETGLIPDLALQAGHVRACVARFGREEEYFRRVYRAAFDAGREAGKRDVNMEVAGELWAVLFAPTMGGWRSSTARGGVDWLGRWREYLEETFFVEAQGENGSTEKRWKRTVSRDLWNQLLVFAGKTLENGTLRWWSEEQAWPGVIDEFVVWCREKGVVPKEAGEDEAGMEEEDYR